MSSCCGSTEDRPSDSCVPRARLSRNKSKRFSYWIDILGNALRFGFCSQAVGKSSYLKHSIAAEHLLDELRTARRPMLERTTLQLFRDCLRTAHHIGGDSAKGRALKQVVKEGFRKHIGVTDAAEISKLKADAVRALSNYLVMKSLNKTKK